MMDDKQMKQMRLKFLGNDLFSMQLDIVQLKVKYDFEVIKS